MTRMTDAQRLARRAPLSDSGRAIAFRRIMLRQAAEADGRPLKPLKRRPRARLKGVRATQMLGVERRKL